MSKLLCAALLTLAIGCKDKAADAPKPTTTTQPSDPSPAARKAEAPKLPDQPTGSAGSGTPISIESREPGAVVRHKSGVIRGPFPVKESYEALRKKKEAAGAAKR